MKTTRDEDLQMIEEASRRTQTEEGRIHRQALMEAIYEQTKDAHLERLRRDLTEAIARQDWTAYVDCHNRVSAYASTPAFRKRMARAMARISTHEAELYLERR